MLALLVFTLSFLTSANLNAAAEANDNESARENSREDEFSYYLNEFTQNELPKGDPMAQLITDGLVSATFSTAQSESFKLHLRQLKNAAKQNPTKLERFLSLDARLQIAFQEKLGAARHKRLLYTAAGAMVGGVVGLPIGKYLSSSSSLGSKMLFISIPAGALAGAGAGYLLGELIEMPDYSYEEGEVTRDLQLDREEINRLETE